MKFKTSKSTTSTLTLWALTSLLLIQLKYQALANLTYQNENSPLTDETVDYPNNPQSDNSEIKLNSSSEIEESSIPILPVDISSKESNVLTLNLLKLWRSNYFNHLPKPAQKAFDEYYFALNSAINEPKGMSISKSLIVSNLLWDNYHNFCLKSHTAKSPTQPVNNFISQVKSYSDQLEKLSHHGHLDIKHRISLANSYSKVAKAYFEQIPAEHFELKKASEFYKDSAVAYLKILNNKKDINHPAVTKSYAKLVNLHKNLIDTYSKSLHQPSPIESHKKLVSTLPETSTQQNKSQSNVDIHSSKGYKNIDSLEENHQWLNQQKHFTQNILKKHVETPMDQTKLGQFITYGYQEQTDKTPLPVGEKKRTQISKNQSNKRAIIIETNDLGPDEEQKELEYDQRAQFSDEQKDVTLRHEDEIANLNDRLGSLEKKIKEAFKNNLGMKEDWEGHDNQGSTITSFFETQREEATKLEAEIESLRAQAKHEESMTKQSKATLNSKLSKLKNELELHQRANENFILRLRLDFKTLEKQKKASPLLFPPSRRLTEKLQHQSIQELGSELGREREKLRNLKQQLEDLKAQEKLNNKANKNDEKRHSIEIAQLRNKLEEVSLSYQQVISELENRLLKQESHLKEALGKNVNLLRDLDENDNQIEKLTSRIDVQRQETQRLEKEVEILRAQAKDNNIVSNREREALNLKLSKLEKQLEVQQQAAKQSIIRLRAQLEKLEQEKQAFKLVFHASQKVKDRFKLETIQNLTSDVEKGKERIRHLENNLKDLKTQQEQNDTATTQEKRRLGVEIARLSTKLEDETVSHQAALSELQNRLRAQEIDLSKALNKNVTLKETLKEKNNQIGKLTSEIEARRKETSQTILGLEDEIKIREQKIQVLEKQLEDLKAQEDQNKAATDLERENHTSEIARLNSELKYETASYEKALSELKDRLRAQEDQLQRSQEENETLKSNFSKFEKQNNILFAEAHAHFKELSERKVLEEQDRHENELAQVQAKATQEKEELNTTIAQLRENLEQQQKLLETEQDKGKNLENQLKNEKEKLQGIQQTKAQRDINAKNAIAAEVARKTETLQHKLDQQNKLIERQKDSLQKSNDELEELKSQTAFLEGEKNDLNIQVLQLEGKNQSLRRELATNESQIIELEKMGKTQLQQITNLEYLLKTSRNDYKKLSQELENEKAVSQNFQDQKLEARLQEVYDKLGKATQDLDLHKKLIAKYEKEAVSDKAKIQQLENSRIEHQKTLENLLLEMKDAEEAHQQELGPLKTKLNLLNSSNETLKTQIESQNSQLEAAQAKNRKLESLLKEAQAQLNEFLTEKDRNISRIEKQVESLEIQNRALKEKLQEKLNLAAHRGKEYVENEIAIREKTIHEHNLRIGKLIHQKDMLKGNLDKLNQMLEGNDTTQILSYFSPEVIPEIHKNRENGSKIHLEHEDLDQDLNNLISNHQRIIEQKHDELKQHDTPTLKLTIDENTALNSMKRAESDRKNEIETAKKQFDLLNTNAHRLIGFVESLLELPNHHQRVENLVTQTKAKIDKLVEDNKLQNYLTDDPEISILLNKLERLKKREIIGTKFLGEYGTTSCSDKPMNQKNANLVQLLSNDIDDIYEEIAKRLDTLHIKSEISKFLKDILEDYIYDNKRGVHSLLRNSPDIPINYSQLVSQILQASENFIAQENGITSQREKVKFNYNNREYSFEFQFMHNPDSPKHHKYLIPLKLDQGELKLGSEATFKEVYHALNMSDFHREVYFHVKNEGSLGVNYIDERLNSQDQRGGSIDKRVAFNKTKDEIIAEQNAMRLANGLLHRENRSHKNVEHYLEPYYGIDLNQVFERRKNKDSRNEFDQENEWLKLRDDCAKAIISQMDRLHKNNFIHRDIKPQNIMFKVPKKGENSPVCNLIDFGSSIFYANGKIVSAGYNFTPGFVGWKYDLKANEADTNYEHFRNLEKTINDDNKILFSNKNQSPIPSVPTENPEDFSNWMLAKLGRDDSGNDVKGVYQYLGIHNDYFQMAIVLLNLYYGNDDQLGGEVSKIMNVLKNLDLLRLYDRSGTMPEDGGPGGMIRKFLNLDKVKNGNNDAVKLMKTLAYAFFPVSYVNNTLDPNGHFFGNIHDCSKAIKTYLEKTYDRRI